MKLIPKKIIVFFLLVVFLAVSLGNAFGFIACERGCLSDIHSKNHFADHQHNANVVSLSRNACGDADTCLDYLIPLTDGIQTDSVRPKCPEAVSLLPSFPVMLDTANIRLSVIPLRPRLIPIISQTILSHRTVVLRH